MECIVLVLTRSPSLDISQRLLNMPNLLPKHLETKIYLLYDGVVAAKKGYAASDIKKLIKKRVAVFVDLQEFKARGFDALIDGVKVLDNPVSELVDDIMRENSRVIVV